MKKVIVSICLCCLMCVCFLGGCTNDTTKPQEPEINPIVGTWICEKGDHNSKYYAIITPKENDKYNLEYKKYHIYSKNEFSESPVRNLLINPKIEGKYHYYGKFNPMIVERDYEFLLQDDETFIVQGVDVENKNEYYQFKRTTMTLDEYLENLDIEK